MCPAADVPALVRRYLDGALPAGGSTPQQVRVTQVGEMCQKPGGRWLPFTAVEEFAVEDVAFSWRARFPIAPLVWLRVVDRYAAGEGLLEARLWGLVRVMRARGQEASEGEVLRYLAELVWVPHAMVASRRLEWRGLDAQAVEVTTRVGSARATVRLEFDDTGDIVGTWCEARPYIEGKTSHATTLGRQVQRLRGCRRHSDSDPRRGAVGAPGRAVHLLARHDHLDRTRPLLRTGTQPAR